MLKMNEVMRADLLRLTREEMAYTETTDTRRLEAIERVPAGTDIDLPIPDRDELEDELEGLSDAQIAGMVKDYHYGNFEPPLWAEAEAAGL